MRALLPLVLAACTGSAEISAWEASTLEAAVVQVGADIAFEAGNRRDFVGTVTLSGADRDWLLTVDTSTVRRTIDIHTPSAADLSVLDGLDGARVTIEREPQSEELSIGVSDGTGRVLYLLEPAEPGMLSRDLLGAGLIGRGDDLGSVRVDSWELTLSSGLLRTDSGDVELFPGEPQAVTIERESYRAVLLASYDAELTIEGNVRCTGATDRLAFELLRVDDPDLAPRVRPEGQSVPTSTCVPL